MTPNSIPDSASPLPRHVRRHSNTGTRKARRIIVPLLLELLTVLWSPLVQAQVNPLTINAPAAIAAQYPSPPPATGALSWAPIDVPVTGQIAYEEECCPGSPAKPFPSDPKGKIALIDESEFSTGACTVSSAIGRAATAGAIAVVIVMPDWYPPEFFDPTYDLYYDYQDGPGAYVPTLLVDFATASILKGSADPVTVTISPGPGIRGVRTLPGTELSLTSETLNGLVYPNGVETTVYFEYGADPSYGSTTPEVSLGSEAATISVSAVIACLTPNSVFHYRLVANGGDTYTFGRNQVFTTASLPIIAGQPADQQAMAGEPVVISATVAGSAPFSYQWLRNGTVIVPFATGTNQLSLPPVKLSDAGNYRVEVKNPYTGGTPVSSSEAHLTVIPKALPVPVTAAVSNVRKIEATLNGTVNPKGGYTTVQFEYGGTTGYGTKTPPVALGHGTGAVPVSAVLPPFSLASGTAFHYRLVATSVAGTARGADVVFTTVPAVDFIVSNTFNTGPGSLRNAIAAAELADTIHFDPALNGQTITLTGALFFDHGVRIFGPGASVLAVSGNNASTLCSIDTAGSAAISGLTFRNGRSSNFSSGGAVWNRGTLTMEDCVISDSRAGLYGGGMLNSGTLTLRRCSFARNTASISGGGLSVQAFGKQTFVSECSFTDNTISPGQSFSSGGGAIHTQTSTTVSLCVFERNSWVTTARFPGTTAGGGAVFSEPRNAAEGILLESSTFRNNSCPVGAGGAVLSAGSQARMTIRSCTFTGNLAWGGGAIQNENSQNELLLSNSTVSGNKALNYGGGISVDGGGMTLRGCTVTGNQAPGVHGGGIRVYGADFFDTGNSLVAGNTSAIWPDVAMLDFGGNPMAVSSSGHNIIGMGEGSLGWTAADLVGSSADPVDVRIGPLADNGGPTMTHALLPGSPAIDSGDSSLTDSSNDQRGAGYARLYGKAVDAGAYEVSDPFTIHGDVLFDMNLLQQSTTDPRDAARLTSAINKLTAVLAPSFWEDPYRLVPETGDRVFSLDLSLVEILQDIRSGTAAALARSMADRIARAGREIAVTEIEDAALRGGATQKALDKLAKGDEALARGKPASYAIEHFQSAWKESLKAKNECHGNGSSHGGGER